MKAEKMAMKKTKKCPVCGSECHNDVVCFDCGYRLDAAIQPNKKTILATKHIIIEATIQKGRLLLIYLPKEAVGPWLTDGAKSLNWYIPTKVFGEEGNTWSEGVTLPSGDWKILGWSDDNNNHKKLGITAGEYLALLFNNVVIEKRLILIEKA